MAFRPGSAIAIKTQLSQFKFNQMVYGVLWHSKLGGCDAITVSFSSNNATLLCYKEQNNCVPALLFAVGIKITCWGGRGEERRGEEREGLYSGNTMSSTNIMCRRRTELY